MFPNPLKLNQLKSKLRSIHPLTKEDLLYVAMLTPSEKYELIVVYNNMMEYMADYIELTFNNDKDENK